MSKIIYLCYRGDIPQGTGSLLKKITNRLSPDNITPKDPVIFINGKVAYAIMNPSGICKAKDSSVLVGQFYESMDGWHVPKNEFPDGCYALFRESNSYIEVVADPVATRTIWYYTDENLFIASTSQRAIIMLLGNFDFDNRVIPWMLSTGTIGPCYSWDKRIKRITPDSSVLLDRENWDISIKTNHINFHPVNLPKSQQRKFLEESLSSTFKSFKIDWNSWVLPLSGGYDSRGILLFLRDNKNNGVGDLRTITWGLRSSLNKKDNDAYIATSLATKLGLKHKYYFTDFSSEPLDKIINRFIQLGEGRIDALAGYMDGFDLWKNLFEDNIEGILRGDEAFGGEKLFTSYAVRYYQSCCLCDDFANLSNYRDFGFPVQEFPDYLRRMKNETVKSWTDRVNIEHYLPVILSALSDLKLSYVEQISPLLSRRIINNILMLSDQSRIKKSVYKKIVSAKTPDIGFAKIGANAPPYEILRQPEVVKLMMEDLSSDTAGRIFPSEFLGKVMRGIESFDKNKGLVTTSLAARRLVALNIPPRFTTLIYDKLKKPTVDGNVLAFRVLIIIRMSRLLNLDRETR